MSHSFEEDEEVLLTSKRQKTKKIAIDSDAEDDFSNFLAKPTKQEKEPLERKDYPHNSVKKNTPKPKEKSGENNVSDPSGPREEKPMNNGDKEHIIKEKEHVHREKESQQKEKEPAKKEKEPKHDHFPKEKPKENKEVKPVVKKEPQKPIQAKKPTNSAQKPALKKILGSDSENSLFEPEVSSDGEKAKKHKAPLKNQSPAKGKKPIQKQQLKPKPKETPKTGNIPQSKDSVIRGILRRWWYCMDEWPPVGLDYVPLLREKGLRLVNFANWKSEADFDEEGLEKAYEIEGCQGLFRNSKGALIDFRPKDSCPCFETLKKKSLEELMGMYKTALINQISKLEGFKDYQSPELMTELKRELNKVLKLTQAG